METTNTAVLDGQLPVDAPALLTPGGGSTVRGQWISFTWTHVPGATAYWLQVATDPDFQSVIYETFIGSGTALRLYEMLPREGALLFWRMRTHHASGWTEYSTTETFRYVADGADVPTLHASTDEEMPSPVSPRDGDPVEGGAALFAWTAVNDVAGYRVQIAADEGFEWPLWEIPVQGATSVTLYDLLPENDARFVWRAGAEDRNGRITWGPAARFRAASDASVDAFLAQKMAPLLQAARVAPARAEQAVQPVEPPVLRGMTSPRQAAGLFVLMMLSFVLTLALLFSIAP